MGEEFMNPATTEETRHFHELHCRLTGLQLPYTMMVHFKTEAILAQGFTENDLEMVVAYIKRRIKQKRREKESLLPRNLFRSWDNLQEELSMARAENRAPSQQPERKSVLLATGRQETAFPPALSTAQVMVERAKLAAMLAEWRKAQ